MNPFSIGYARQVGRKLCKDFLGERGMKWEKEVHSVGLLYGLLVGEILHKRWGGGCFKRFIHNCNHLKGGDLRRNTFLMMVGGWRLKCHLQHMKKGMGRKCRLCGEGDENYSYLLRQCSVVNRMKYQWNQGLEDVGVTKINFGKWGWGLGEKDQGKDGAKSRLICLKLLREVVSKSKKGVSTDVLAGRR